MSIGIVKHSIYLQHETDAYHPENPKRLEHIYRMLENLDPADLDYIEPRMASHEELALNHTASYINEIASTSGQEHTYLDSDTVASARTYEAACMAAGGVLQLADAIMSSRVQSGFAFVRPPGHHAEQGKAMGFCIFNNVAIAARYLHSKYGMNSILIVDFDLHHGNGTQHSFYKDRGVLYFSTHQYPYYPGSGWYEEIGADQGTGYTVNIPMSQGMGDDDYVYAFKDVLLPVAEMYRPEFVLVSAGFDTYYKDPLGGMEVTESGFSAMTRILMDLAHRCCEGRLLFVLEGGYDLKGLAACTEAVTKELQGRFDHPYEEKKGPSSSVVQMTASLKRLLLPYWGHF